jgi:hypothetical protein
MAFRRLVLMGEDVYKNALKCMEKEALARTAERTIWYEKDNVRGVAQKSNVPIAERIELPTQDAALHVPAPHEDTPDTVHDPVRVPGREPEREQTPSAEQTPSVELVETPTHVEDVVVQPSEEFLPPKPNTKDIPISQRKKYFSVFRKVLSSKRILVDSEGRLVIAGEGTTPNSSFHKLMRSLFTASGDEPVGFRRFLEELKGIGVKPNEVVSQFARLALRDVQHGRGHKGIISPPGKRLKVLRVYK